jgi:chemotaxis protein histidine kinase CheA
MASAKPSKPDVVTYGDHEMITPDTRKLRRTMRNALPGEPDPVEAAERALSRLSGDFRLWMNDECAKLDVARCKIRDSALTKESGQELFLAAHDIKGDGATFGFAEVVRAADSLCRLLEHSPDLAKIPMAIIDQHVDAIRAIVREHSRADIGRIAGVLTQKLKTVTDEFLIAENQDRPEVLKVIQSPSLIPGD